MELENRVTELETRMVYAEDTISGLNRTIAEQNSEIENLRNFCIELKKKVEELREEGGGEPMGHERPPHY